MPDDEVPQSDRHRAFSDEREPPQLPPSAWAPRPGDPVGGSSWPAASGPAVLPGTTRPSPPPPPAPPTGPAWQTARRPRSSARRGWWWAAGAFVALGMSTAGSSGTDHGAYGGGAGMGDVQCDADASGNIVQDSPECRELARTMGGASVDDGTGRPTVVDPAGDVLQCQVRVDGVLVSLQTAAVSDAPGELLAVTCTVPLSRAR